MPQASVAAVAAAAPCRCPISAATEGHDREFLSNPVNVLSFAPFADDDRSTADFETDDDYHHYDERRKLVSPGTTVANPNSRSSSMGSSSSSRGSSSCSGSSRKTTILATTPKSKQEKLGFQALTHLTHGISDPIRPLPPCMVRLSELSWYNVLYIVIIG